MFRRQLIASAAVCVLLGSGAAAQAQNGPRIAVTDLAYKETVSQYFEVGTYQRSASLQASGSAQASSSHGMAGGSASYSGHQSLSASSQASGTYAAGAYSYIEQRELGAYTNDIKGALLQGTSFRLVQGRGFDGGTPQASKAEQVLQQVQTGRVATPVRQPDVTQVIARIRKGEFGTADYVLFGVVSSIEFRDTLSPLQGTTTVSHQYGLDLLADFSLINTRTFEVKAAFSAQGAGNDVKLISSRGDVVPPNRANVMRETSRSLAADVYQQLAAQLGAGGMGQAVRPGGLAPGAVYPAQPPQPQPAPVEQVLILR